MAVSMQSPPQGLQLRPTSRLTWLGLGLLVLSIAGAILQMMGSTLLDPNITDSARATYKAIVEAATALPALAAPVVLLAAIVLRHERSVVGIGATIFSVLLLGIGILFFTYSGTP